MKQKQDYFTPSHCFLWEFNVRSLPWIINAALPHASIGLVQCALLLSAFAQWHSWPFFCLQLFQGMVVFRGRFLALQVLMQAQSNHWWVGKTITFVMPLGEGYQDIHEQLIQDSAINNSFWSRQRKTLCLYHQLRAPSSTTLNTGLVDMNHLNHFWSLSASKVGHRFRLSFEEEV